MKYTEFIHEIETNPDYIEAKEALKIHFAFGDAVLRARTNLGWSQAELAERVGTKQANISRIEAGLANPTINLVQRILKILDIDVYFTPASSTTSSKTVSFDFNRSIPVPNWPVNPVLTTNSRKTVQL